MEVQWLSKHQWFACLWSNPPAQNFGFSWSLLWDVDAIRRLEVRCVIFLHGFNSKAQQFEHSFKGFIKKKENLQSARGKGASWDLNPEEELLCFEYFWMIFCFWAYNTPFHMNQIMVQSDQAVAAGCSVWAAGCYSFLSLLSPRGPPLPPLRSPWPWGCPSRSLLTLFPLSSMMCSYCLFSSFLNEKLVTSRSGGQLLR